MLTAAGGELPRVVLSLLMTHYIKLNVVRLGL